MNPWGVHHRPRLEWLASPLLKGIQRSDQSLHVKRPTLTKEARNGVQKAHKPSQSGHRYLTPREMTACLENVTGSGG